jgi:uncharacterized membrane protein
MWKPILMGIIAGQRALTPLAVVAVAARRGELSLGNGAPRVLGHSAAATAAVALAAGEMAGDKMKPAPDRVMPAGLVARFATAAIAGAALAPRKDRWAAAAAGGAAAVLASYIGWRGRLKAMERQSQTATGFIEDAAVLGSAVAVVRS